MKKSFSLSLIVIISLTYIQCTDDDTTLTFDSDLPSGLPSDSIPTNEKNDSLPLGKYIYLTIDDAPINGSEYLDSVITAEKVKVSLFVVGNVTDESKRFLRYHNMFKENQYIEIYNHSYSHANNRYASYYKKPESVLEDFEINQTQLSISHKIARLPGRNLWHLGERKKNYQQTGATSAALLAENGYQIFGWDVEWKYESKGYAPKQTIDELVDEIEEAYNKSTTFTTNHVVLLFHNQMFGKINDKNNLGELIGKLRDKEYIFAHLTSYPATN